MEKSDFKILVAEDDEIVRDVIAKFLAGEGYTVVVASDGPEAIKVLRLEEIKLVLTDLRMPGADGIEVLRTAIRINPKVSVVILTAYGTLDTALEAMKEGAYDYIVKPFVMQQLLLVVRNAYKMSILIRENEDLSEQLRETHSAFEHIRQQDGRHKTAEMNSTALIERLRALNVIDEEETKVLKERLVAGSTDENIKKYSLLVNELKSSS